MSTLSEQRGSFSLSIHGSRYAREKMRDATVRSNSPGGCLLIIISRIQDRSITVTKHRVFGWFGMLGPRKLDTKCRPLHFRTAPNCTRGAVYMPILRGPDHVSSRFLFSPRSSPTRVSFQWRPSSIERIVRRTAL